MMYDTGAMVSLLPSRFYDILGVEKYASIKLTGISPESEVTARLTGATLRLEDIEGNGSPGMEAWVAIAERDDVPLILGLRDIADTHELIVKPRERIFYLQFHQVPTERRRLGESLASPWGLEPNRVRMPHRDAGQRKGLGLLSVGPRVWRSHGEL